MLVEEIVASMNELVISINLANQSYYFTGNKIIPDDQYDQLVNDLKLLEEEYPNHINPNSPNNKTIRRTVNIDDYVSHVEPYKLNTVIFMDQSLSNDVLEEYIKRTEETCINKHIFDDTKTYLPIDYFVSELYSGVNVSLVYKSGLLSQAILLGNGYTGKNIIDIVKSILNVPIKINSHDEKNIDSIVYVRGIITIPKFVYDNCSIKYDFTNTNEKMVAISTNKVLGYTTVINNIINSENNDLVISNPLSFIADDIILSDDNSSDFTNISDKLMWLESVGFTIPKYKYISDLNVNNYRGYLQSRSEVDISIYPLAGFNLSVDNIATARIVAQSIGCTKVITFRISKTKINAVINNALFSIDKNDSLVCKLDVHNNTAIDNTHILDIDTNMLNMHTLHVGDSIDIIVFDNTVIEILSVNKTSLSKDRILTPTNCPACGHELHNELFSTYCINTTCDIKSLNITKRYIAFNDNQKRLVSQEVFNILIDNLLIDPISLFNEEYLTNVFMNQVKHILSNNIPNLSKEELDIITSQTMASLIPRSTMTIFDLISIYNITEVEVGMLNGVRLETFGDLLAICSNDDIKRTFINSKPLMLFVNQPHIQNGLLSTNIKHPLVDV